VPAEVTHRGNPKIEVSRWVQQESDVKAGSALRNVSDHARAPHGISFVTPIAKALVWICSREGRPRQCSRKVLTMDEARRIAIKRCKVSGDLLGKRATTRPRHRTARQHVSRQVALRGQQPAPSSRGPHHALPQALQTNFWCWIVATRYGACNRHLEIEPSAGKCIRMVRLLTQNATGLLRMGRPIARFCLACSCR